MSWSSPASSSSSASSRARSPGDRGCRRCCCSWASACSAGSEGLGGIYFDDAGLARSVGVVALALILFSGGLDTRWASIRPVLGRGIVLATAGTLVTAGLVGGVVMLVTDLPVLEALLLGAVVSSTDAAAVFSVLRARQVRLPARVREPARARVGEPTTRWRCSSRSASSR